MSNVVISLIRTWTPIVVGTVLAWLAAHGLNLDPVASSGLIAGLTGLLAGAFYAIARVLETRFPWLGFLLGHTAKPSYGKAGK